MKTPPNTCVLCGVDFKESDRTLDFSIPPVHGDQIFHAHVACLAEYDGCPFTELPKASPLRLFAERFTRNPNEKALCE